MKQKKLAPLLTIVMCFQLIVSPVVANAQSSAGFGNMMNGLLGVAGALTGASGPQVASDPNAATNEAMINEMQAPSEDKWFNASIMGRIPGLLNYMAAQGKNPNLLVCPTLRTTLNEVRFSGCSSNPPQGNYNYNEMAGIANHYKDSYEQIAKMYNNYSADSLGGGASGTQGFGVGCMNNAKAILDAYFQSRLDELDKLVTNLEALNNQFREASRTDLNAIEENTALLDGGDGDYVNEAKTRRPDLFDFSKRFENQACKSMYALETFNDRGREGGLNKINSAIKTQRSTKPANGKYSGESYMSANASIVADINNMARSVSTQANLNFSAAASNPNSFYSSLKSSVSSTNGLQSILDAGFFSTANASFMTGNQRLQSEMSAIKSELGASAIDSSRAERMLTDLKSGGFENELVTIENKIKNNCLSATVSSSGGMATILGRIYDPTTSKFANKNASSFLRTKIEQIMSNSSTSTAKKLADLQALDGEIGGRYYLRMDNAYEVQEYSPTTQQVTTRKVPASTNRTPSVYFADLIINCESKFQANKLNNQMSGAQAIARLRALNTNYKTLARTFASDLSKNITDKLIECSSPAEANNEVAGSCTPERFAMNANFCAKGAATCAGNMAACGTQAQNFVTEAKNDRTARVNNYKASLNRYKQTMVQTFDRALAQFMSEGDALRGIFAAGFSSPAGVEREVPQNDRYLADLKEGTQGSPDGALLLEDPDKYMAMFKKNAKLLKDSVKAQQDQITGARSPIATHITNTKRTYGEVESKARDLANQCVAGMAAIGTLIAQQNELGQKKENFCSRLGMLNENPAAACSGNIEDLTTTNLGPGMNSYQAQFANICERYGSHSSENSSLDADRVCAKSIFQSRSTDTASLLGRISNLCQDMDTKCGNVPTRPADEDDSEDGSEEDSPTRSRGSTVILNPQCNRHKATIEANYMEYLESNEGDSPSNDIGTPANCMNTDNSGRGIQNGLDAILNSTRGSSATGG